MSLLVDMMANTLDEAYAERAGRKAGAPTHTPGSPAPRDRRVVTVAVLVALGVLTGSAVAQVRGREQADTGLRGQLATEAQQRTAQSAALDARAQRLRRELGAVRETALSTDTAGRAVADRLRELGLASATIPVQGPGVVITLDDPDTGPARPDLPTAALADGRVRDTDLQDTANALWAAGAEAISINGQRLTALTAIRLAGDAILVDLLPLKPPYVVRAIGRPASLELGFSDGPVGRRLFDYTNAYGMRLEVRRADDQQLPGAADPRLRAARPSAAAAGSS
ncbi:MAG: DUF881 domain-containing protein [Frankiales bacterium]|nr:DUF881 domain-containing protein [Frankiales bacterium]